MSKLLEVWQLDAAIKELNELKESIPLPWTKSRKLNKAIDQLDDLRELLVMPRIGRPQARPESLFLNLLSCATLVLIGVHVGIQHGRAQCQAENVARVGP